MELKQKNDIFRLTIAALAMACMILDPKCGIRGAEIGIELCIKTVIPSLFTFFVISIYLTPCMQTIPAWAFRPLEFLFRIPKGTGVLLLIGILGGYPVGAKIITDARRNKSISQSVADRMLAFSSNAGPAFIFGMSTSLFDHRSAPWLLWGIHILSAWLVSLLVKPPEAKCSPDEKYKRITISEAMKNAIQVMAGVCGGIILFRVILAFLQRWFLWLLPISFQAIVCGMLELSNGFIFTGEIEQAQLRFILCSGMLGFGGICVLMQTASVCAPYGTGKYLGGKVLQCIVSILLSLLLVPLIV